MKNKTFILTGILALSGIALANGFMGDNPPSRIPIPARDYSARVTDHGGTEIKVDRVSWNGEVFLYGNLGSAQVTLPFDSLASVSFTKVDEDTRAAKATTTKGETITVHVDEDTPCYGRTSFGNYAIKAEDIREIHFLHP